MGRISIDSFADLLAEAQRFRDAREWAPFHSAKNLAAAIAIEAAELQEVLLWASDPPSAITSEQQRRIREELADVVIHCANLALALDIDLPRALADKFDLNEAKYPVEKARGNAAKYTEF